MPTCTGCRRVLSPIADSLWTVCFDCTKARARAAGNGWRCTCGKRAIPRPIVTAHRSWIGCDRCLGSITAAKAA